nr:DUF3325 domain-containing protein [Variovorax boronicumulans]
MKGAVLAMLMLSAAGAGFTALALAMDRHHEDCFGRGNSPSARRRRTLEAFGSVALALSLGAALAREGSTQGWVLWLGALTLAAVLVVGLLSYLPRLGFKCLYATTVLALLASLAVTFTP